MIAVSWETIRVSLHVLAATIWVGGQLVLAALVPVLRRSGGDAVTLAARRFNVIAWGAFAVLIATGVWNVLAERGHIHGAYRTTLTVKLVSVAISGLAAAVHIRTQRPTARAVSAAFSGGAALLALFLGVLLAG